MEAIVERILEMMQEKGMTSYTQWDRDIEAYIQFNHLDRDAIINYMLEHYFIKRDIIWVDTYNHILDCVSRLDDTNIVLYKPERTILYSGDGNEDYDKEYCEKEHIPVVKVGYLGGNIVTTQNDLGMVIKIDMSGYNFIFDKFAEYLGGDKVGNDIMIYWEKICGTSFGQNIAVLQFSFDDNTELAKRICRKAMHKKPGSIEGITGISRDDMLSWMQTRLIK